MPPVDDIGVEVQGRVIVDYPKSYLIDLDDQRTEWIPKSHIIGDVERKGDWAAFSITQWLARKLEI